MGCVELRRENWKYLQFEDVFVDVSKRGKKIPKSDYLSEGRFPIIDQGQKYVAGYSNSSEKLYSDVPALIFGDHTRIIKYVDVPFFLGADGVKLLKSKLSDVDYKFLYYVLSQLHIIDTGYNRHFKYLKEQIIPLPPLDEQKRIAEVLDKASELIKKRKEQIRLMDELAKSLFIEMFGDPVENPMGWELGKLSEHTNILTGYPFDSSKYVEDKSQIKICGGLIIMPDKIDWDSANYWSSSEADNLDKYFLQTDDIVLAMDRPWISSGIKVGMIKQDNLPAILIQRTARIRGIGMQQYYLFELFKSPLFTNHCKPTETTVPHIAMGDIKKFVIPLPPLPLQNEFADRIAVIEQQKTLLQNGLAKMETAYKALMQEYFDAERPLLEQNT